MGNQSYHGSKNYQDGPTRLPPSSLDSSLQEIAKLELEHGIYGVRLHPKDSSQIIPIEVAVEEILAGIRDTIQLKRDIANAKEIEPRDPGRLR
ncbi:MAG: hypothetical protein AABY22_26190 [Nanoarchaeota archaeon]